MPDPVVIFGKEVAQSTILKAFITVASTIYQANKARAMKRAMAQQRQEFIDRNAARNIKTSGSNVSVPHIYGFSRIEAQEVLVHVINDFNSQNPETYEALFGNLSGSDSSRKNEILVLQRILGFSPIEAVMSMDVDQNSLVLREEDGNLSAKQPFFDYVKSYVDLNGGNVSAVGQANINDTDILPSTSTFNDIVNSTEFFRMNRNDPQFGGRPTAQYYIHGKKVPTIEETPDVTHAEITQTSYQELDIDIDVNHSWGLWNSTTTYNTTTSVRSAWINGVFMALKTPNNGFENVIKNDLISFTDHENTLVTFRITDTPTQGSSTFGGDNRTFSFPVEWVEGDSASTNIATGSNADDLDFTVLTPGGELRVSTTKTFSNNAVRCLLDYITQPSDRGPGLTSDDLDLDSWNIAILNAENVVQPNASVSGKVFLESSQFTVEDTEEVQITHDFTLGRGFGGDDGRDVLDATYNIVNYLPKEVRGLAGNYTLTITRRYSRSSMHASYAPDPDVTFRQGDSTKSTPPSRTRWHIRGRLGLRFTGLVKRRVLGDKIDSLQGEGVVITKNNRRRLLLRNLKVKLHGQSTFTDASATNSIRLKSGTKLSGSGSGFVRLTRDTVISSTTLTLENDKRASNKFFESSNPRNTITGNYGSLGSFIPAENNDEEDTINYATLTQHDQGTSILGSITRNIIKHEFNGILDTKEDHIANISKVLDTIPGSILYRDVLGKIKIDIPDERFTNEQHSVDTITEKDIIGFVEIQQPDTNSKLNRITVNYANASKDFTKDSVILNDTDLLALDSNLVLKGVLDLDGVINSYAANYIARAEIKESRRPVYKWKEAHSAVFREPGDVVLLSPSTQKIRTNDTDLNTGKYIRITNTSINNDLTVSLEGLEFDIADYIYDTDTSEAVASETVFDFAVPAPTNFTASKLESEAAVTSVSLSWTEADDVTITEYQIESTIDAGATYQGIGVVPIGTTTFSYVPPVADIATRYRIRSKTIDLRYSEFVESSNLTPVFNRALDGINTATVEIYQRATTAPTSAPLITGTYTFDSEEFLFSDGAANNNGWYTTIPSGTDTLFSRRAAVISKTNTASVTIDKWSNVVEAESTSLNEAIANYYIRTSSETSPSPPDTDALYTYATASLTPTLNNGWRNIPPSSGGDYLWIVRIADAVVGATSTIDSDRWGAPVLISAPGPAGDDGDAYVTVVLYQNSTTSPTIPLSNVGYNTDGEAVATGSWTVNPSSLPAGQFTWRTNFTLRRPNNTGNWVGFSSSWSTPERLTGEEGEAGENAYGAKINLTGSPIFEQESDAGWPTSQTSVGTIVFTDGTTTDNENYTVSISGSGVLSGAVSSANSNITVTTDTSGSLFTVTWTHSSGSNISQQYEARKRPPRQTSKIVYYTSAQATAPSNPSATSINFDTGAITGLSAGWSTNNVQIAITSTTLAYWQAELLFTESDFGGTQTVTVLQTPSGRVTFGDDIASDNYVTGSSGWIIERDTGNAEFSNVTIRGDSQVNGNVIVENTITSDKIQVNTLILTSKNILSIDGKNIATQSNPITTDDFTVNPSLTGTTDTDVLTFYTSSYCWC